MNKVRVQLLDNKTGAVLEEVDVLTSADSVSFDDGETFQQKLNNGKLKGQKGDTGSQGPQGQQGAAGQKGADGVTPTIGANGNWYIGSTDTGKPARGITGPQGPKGDVGTQGPQGLKGNTGATGPKGDTGAQGPQGLKGDKGDSGEGVKFGTSYATASDVKVFFKKI